LTKRKGFQAAFGGCSTLRGFNGSMLRCSKRLSSDFQSLNQSRFTVLFKQAARPDSSGFLFFPRRQGTHEIAFGQVSDGFAGLGKGSGYLGGGIDPQYRERRRADN